MGIQEIIEEQRKVNRDATIKIARNILKELGFDGGELTEYASSNLRRNIGDTFDVDIKNDKVKVRGVPSDSRINKIILTPVRLYGGWPGIPEVSLYLENKELVLDKSLEGTKFKIDDLKVIAGRYNWTFKDNSTELQ